MQCKFAEFVDDGVTGVAAALIAHDNVIVGADEVDHAALALVAPVDAYDRSIHMYLPNLVQCHFEGLSPVRIP